MNQHQSPVVSPAPSSDEPNVKSVVPFQIRDVVDQVWGNFLKAVEGELDSSGAPTGFDDLDDMIGGLAPGLHFLAGRPSMGKTTFMLNIVEHMSVEKNMPCLILTGDSTSYELTRRMVFSRARQPARMTYGYSHHPEKAVRCLIRKAVSHIADAHLFIDDSFDLTIESLQRIAARYKKDENIGFIAIDHLHLLRSVFTRAELSREREIVEIVAKIRGLARELNIPILLIANLSRKPESRRRRPAGMPRLSDIRYYNLIEGLATTVALLYRPKYYAESEEEREACENQAHLIVCKNPIGHTGTITFRFDENLRRFEEIGPEWI
jgi:replicative DNA helicase